MTQNMNYKIMNYKMLLEKLGNVERFETDFYVKLVVIGKIWEMFKKKKKKSFSALSQLCYALFDSATPRQDLFSAATREVSMDLPLG